MLLGVGAGGREWMDAATERFPMQPVLLHHYLFAAALGYGVTFFCTTLRDRGLLSIQSDLAALVLGNLLPFIALAVDGLAFGGSLTFNPGDYPPVQF